MTRRIVFLYPLQKSTTIAGLRDFAAHAYFNVSNQIVWDVVKTKLLPLNEAVTRILGGVYPL